MAGDVKPLPPFPDGMQHVWACFAALCQTRPVGFALGAISYAEIEAFNRSTQASLTAADVRLIRQMDEQHLAIKTGAKPKPNNVAGMRATLRGVIAARKAKAAAEGAK